jgi:hypothetical protein
VWNDSWVFTIVQEDEEDVSRGGAGRAGPGACIRVQDELGTDGWEVLYFQGGQAHGVHPPGSWPDDTRERDLLGYAPPDLRKLAEEIA